MDQQPKPSWWNRNWKWAAPVGCLIPLFVCGGGITLILVLVFGAIKSSDVYTDALAKAKANQEVKGLVGEPIEAGFWTSGNIQINGDSGTADLSIPISGPKGSATIHVAAKKAAGRWEYSTLEVAPQGRDARVDLRHAGKVGGPRCMTPSLIAVFSTVNNKK